MKLSICILAGPSADSLERCLAELAAQTPPLPHEILAAVEPETAVPPRVRQIPGLTVLPPTRGPAAALRAALARAGGEMLALIDPALRLTDPGKLAKQAGWLDRHPEALACLHAVEPPGAAATPQAGARPPALLTAEALLSRRDPLPLGAFVLRRTALAGLPGWFDASDAAGWALAYLLACRGPVWWLPQPMAEAARPGDGTRQDERALLAAALQEAGAERDAATAELAGLRSALAAARARPLRGLRDLASFRLLTALSRGTVPVPSRMAARLARSAAKRDPDRSLTAAAREGAAAAVATESGANRYAGRQVDPQRPAILVVTHEASRTGAPVLALNLCRLLSERYTVVVLSLRDGELRPHFQKHAAEVLVAHRYHRDGAAYAALIGGIARRHPLRFAIVNSLESVAALAPLRQARVPAISLVHEFAAYTLPRSLFPEVVAGSDDTVFSTRLTLENAEALTDLPPDARLHVVPQGKSEVPAAAGADPAAREAERLWLRTALRPPGPGAPPFLVLGAGTVDLRKGLDVFLACAAQAAAAGGGRPLRFAWIGHGYEPDTDMRYSAYLADQIRRAGLADTAIILRQTAEIELAYGLADAFLLSSRLDPLPNVAIDAMLSGLPVLCFDRTTGIAEHLQAAGLGPALVAPYLDTAGMARRIAALAASAEARQEAAQRCRELALARFDMPAYVRAIEAIALAAVERGSGRP